MFDKPLFDFTVSADQHHFFPETHTLIALINFTVFNWQRRQKRQANFKSLSNV